MDSSIGYKSTVENLKKAYRAPGKQQPYFQKYYLNITTFFSFVLKQNLYF